MTFAVMQVSWTQIPYGQPGLQALHLSGGLQALLVAGYRRLGHELAAQHVADGAIPFRGIAVYLQAIPFLRVADVVDGHFVMLAPEEGHGGEGFPETQHVAR